MTRLELLSPARNLECGIEAINHGADAVYIGANRFGARAAAGNSVEDIATLCQYAHQFGAKVYVTVNTIIYDEEINDTIRLIEELQTIGADAILIQDMGLYSLIGKGNRKAGNEPNATLYSSKDTYKKIAFHASTQTDNRTIDKVRWLASSGIKRIVLARELSIDEISEIHRAVPEVELEVFVHGALCVSYSGQCYASQHCFSRSANRGECAQFCRMPFTLKDADGKVLEQSRHLLSLKDMAQIDNLERLAEAGAISFKIEGRLKDSDYVKNITAAYSQRLNDICRKHPDRYQRASRGICTYTFTPDIRKSFNRGFTTYFADSPKNLVSFDTPKSIGEPVGHVKELRGNSFNVSSTSYFNNGDGLCFFDKEHNLIGFRVNRAEGNRLFPLTMPRELKSGTMLYRNYDHAFQTLLAKPSAERKIIVDMVLHITATTLTLDIKDGNEILHTSSTPYTYQAAQKPQDENINRQLTKLGGTIYTCKELHIDSSVEMPFIPSSQLTSLRRQTIESESLMHKASTSTENDCSDIKTPSLPERYSIPYLYNAANKHAREFYESQGVDDATSFEKGYNSERKLLMQCRYCLRAELGYCSKSGHRAPWKEPLTISLSDGKTFTLRFNCTKCQMEVWT